LWKNWGKGDGAGSFPMWTNSTFLRTAAQAYLALRDGGGSMADGTANMAAAPGATTVAAERLRSFLERVERLEEEKSTIAGDIKEVFAEAKGEGYDTKTLRKIIRLRKMDRAKREEEEALLDLYLSALGGV